MIKNILPFSVKFCILNLMLINKIAQILSIDAEEVQRRLSYVGLTDEDRKLLRELSDRLSKKEIANIFKEFYDHLLSFDETREILKKDKGLIDRLQRKQTEYFKQLLEGNHNMDYVYQRLGTGLAHEREGVEPKYYTGAFAKWIDVVSRLIREKVEPDKLLPTILSLVKVVIFDITLSLNLFNN